MRNHIWKFVLALLLPATGANALCIYGGNLYAKTTLAQEFQDSSLVVKGKVLSEQRVYFPSRKDGEPGVINRIQVEHIFKGSVRGMLRYYTELNSGGFYLDKGKSYLLFLDPVAGTQLAKAAPGAMVINYNCGQSRSWAQLSSEDQAQLKMLAVKRPSARTP